MSTQNRGDIQKERKNIKLTTQDTPSTDEMLGACAPADVFLESAEKDTTETLSERRERLLREALALPLCPGVYIMKNERGRVIYVGKSRKLRDRVSQYFRNGEKNLKTERMSAAVYRFEFILCDTEMEALTLENTLIKQYTPRYNIRLKDAKSYPYIKLTSDEYPRLVMSRSRLDDGAKYFGPYFGTSTVFSVMSLVNKTFGLPSCKKSFPRDIGKDRPCLYYRIGQCRGICTGRVGIDEYREMVSCACEVLRGNTAQARRKLEREMSDYAEREEFEAAARCRDTIRSLEKLSQKQKVVASLDCDRDVCGVYIGETMSMMSLLIIRGGALVDKADFPVSGDVIADPHAFCTLLCEHYKRCDNAPQRLLLSFECDDEDMVLLADFLSHIAGKKVAVSTPMIGDNRKLCDMAIENAREDAARLERDTDRSDGIAMRLGALLGLDYLPERIEAYDISNIGDEHITAGMVVYDHGHFCKRDYRTFGIKTTDGANDYGAMREALERRLAHLSDNDGSSFTIPPDLLLIDGGAEHLAVALDVIRSMGLKLTAVGMVKDDYHKTRALITEHGEVSIAHEQDIYGLIYRIQEEVHRFTVSKMTGAKRKTYTVSTLEKIKGIGPAKSKRLLAALGGLAAVKNADIETLAAINGISRAEAFAVYSHFHPSEFGGSDNDNIGTREV